MKTIRLSVNKRGCEVVTVELQPGESLMAFDSDKFYKLGGQVDDIVQGHVISEAVRHYWCSITQTWVESE